jgi:uncharacterized membrane protein YfcA
MTHISWWTYIWATGLVILPLTVLLSVFGASVLSMTGSTWRWLLLDVLAVFGWVMARHHKADTDAESSAGLNRDLKDGDDTNSSVWRGLASRLVSFCIKYPYDSQAFVNPLSRLSFGKRLSL